MTASPHSARRTGRQQAFQVLYGLSFNSQADGSFLERSYTSLLGGSPSSGSPAEAFAWELIQGVSQRLDTLDRVVAGFSHHWKLKRIARIELTILRLALFEMLYRPDIPPKVAINEAIELSKEFGDEKSRNFVNGILDAAAQAIADGTLGSDQKP